MNTIKNVKFGDLRQEFVQPRILNPKHYPHHWEAMELGKDGEPVVMFSTGAVHYGGSVEGENDGIRDGANAGHTDWRKNRMAYCRHCDWVAAGNKPLV